MNRWMDRWIDRCRSQCEDARFIDTSISQSFNQSFNQSINQSITQSINHYHSITQLDSINHLPGVANEFVTFKDHCNTNTGVRVTQISVCSDMTHSFHSYISIPHHCHHSLTHSHPFIESIHHHRSLSTYLPTLKIGIDRYIILCVTLTERVSTVP